MSKKDVYELETIEMPNEIVASHLNNVQGKVLTLIDALFSEGTQNKSVKDTIKSFFSIEHNDVWRYCHPTVRPLSEAEIETINVPENTDEIDVVEVPLKK